MKTEKGDSVSLWPRRKLIWKRQASKREDAFVFYYCVTNDHKLGSLKQYPVISSSSCRSEVWHGMGGLSAQGITGWNWGINQTFSSGGSGEKSTTKLICVGKIQLLAFERQRSPIRCYCHRGATLCLRGSRHSLSCGSFHLQVSMSFSCFQSLTYCFWPLGSYLKGSWD